MVIILLILIWIVLKWCCKRNRRNNEQRERNFEETIQRVDARPAVAAPAMAQVPTMSIPAVTFENPGGWIIDNIQFPP